MGNRCEEADGDEVEEVLKGGEAGAPWLLEHQGERGGGGCEVVALVQFLSFVAVCTGVGLFVCVQSHECVHPQSDVTVLLVH